MTTQKMIRTILLVFILICSGNAHGGNAVVASGEASEESVEAVMHLASATANLSAAGLYLGGTVVIELGRPIANVVLESAEISMDAVAFSADVLAEGLITTAKLSSDLTRAGVAFSRDASLLAAHATAAGIYISAETAGVFLDQAVNIVAASGRLSGETAELVVALSKAGVKFSADSMQLVANAAEKGVKISEETAGRLIAASLDIANECMEDAVVTERYMLMTLKEANQLLHETSLATVAATQKAGRQSIDFTMATVGHLKELGIDAGKYAKELSARAVKAGVKTVVVSITGANDVIVVVINTGSGLIVASVDTLTAAIENTTKKIEK
jgi:hypothetical protein